MEIKRWPAFLALTFSLSFRAFALAQELNDKPDDPSTGSPPVIGTIVFEGEGKAEEPSTEKPDVEGPDDDSKYILLEDGGAVGPIRVGGGQYIRGFNFTGVDPENLPKFVIGVSLTEVPDSLRAHIKLATGAGIMIGAVVPESPAAKAGLQQYDILLKSGDQDLKQPKDLQDLVDAAETKLISITLQRAGELLTLDVTPMKREELKMVPPLGLDFPPGFEQTAGNSASWLQIMNGQALPAPLNMNSFPPGFSPVSPAVGNPAQVEALTDSIRALTEQIERLQRSVDRLEGKPENDSGERLDDKAQDREKDDGDCRKVPRRNRLTTLISIS